MTEKGKDEIASNAVVLQDKVVMLQSRIAELTEGLKT